MTREARKIRASQGEENVISFYESFIASQGALELFKAEDFLVIVKQWIMEKCQKFVKRR